MSALLLCRFAQTTAAVLLAGTAALRLLAWGTDRTPRWPRLAWGCWLALAIAGALQLALTAAEMSDQPLGQALSGSTLGSVLAGTTFGAIWKARAWLLAAALIAQCLLPSAQRLKLSTPLDVIGALLATALLATLVWGGHASASDRRLWLLPTDLVHAIAAGAWPGGLLPLAFLLASARRDPSLLPAALKITRRFSRLSVAAVGFLSAAGFLNAAGLVGSISGLWSSVYGRLILCKVVLLAGMVILGAQNRRSICEEPPTLQRLGRNVAWECALAVLVLLATEALATIAPPASAG